MKLSTRLVLLILGCLLPILTAQVYSQVNLYAERREQVGALVLRQAELVNADISSILDSVQQFGTLSEQFPEIETSAADCGRRLTALQRGLPRYRFLALYTQSDGELLCASQGAPARIRQPTWAADLLTANDLKVGQVTAGADEADRILPVAVRMTHAASDSRTRVLIAGLSVDWLAKHLEGARLDPNKAISGASLYVTDSEGVVIGHVSHANAPTAKMLPEWLHSVLSRDSAGVDTVKDNEGQIYLTGYVPVPVAPTGMAIIDVLPLPELTADIDQATYQDLLVIVAAAGVAVLLAWVASRRFIFKPTEALLRSARRWREGDLTARATLMDAGSEFSALAESFNAMAASLQAREMERRLQSNYLEAQVAERTRELSESNNRLQVEIAGREKTEAALHQAQKLQAVGQLAGGIAHDFNNMLATVLGNLELMERRVSQAMTASWSQADSERLLKLIERATGAVQRGGQLTSRLLAFSRRQRLAARPTDINALLRELITLASSTLGRRVQVVPELADDLWPALVDPSQVEAAILNLCLNARDAMPEGGKLTIITSNATVEPREDSTERDLAPGDYVRIVIADTGTGMTPEVKARAFDPFFTTKGPGAGSGLGLSQVYGMARQSGGGITIDSAPGEGTRVTLSLPRAMETEDVLTPAMNDLARRPATVPGDLILVVDDDHAVRQVTVEMARDLGCEVAQAAGGEQALALMEKLNPPPKYILLDYAMPGMNGLQLAKALRDRGVMTPIALVTGYAELSEGDINTGQLAGLLRKPFTIRELQMLLVQLRTGAGGEAKPVELETNLAGR